MDGFLGIVCLCTLAGQFLALLLQCLHVHRLCVLQEIFLFSDCSIGSGQLLLPIFGCFAGLLQRISKCPKFLLQCRNFLPSTILIRERQPVMQGLNLSGQFLLPASGTCQVFALFLGGVLQYPQFLLCQRDLLVQFLLFLQSVPQFLLQLRHLCDFLRRLRQSLGNHRRSVFQRAGL